MDLLDVANVRLDWHAWEHGETSLGSSEVLRSHAGSLVAAISVRALEEATILIVHYVSACRR